MRPLLGIALVAFALTGCKERPMPPGGPPAATGPAVPASATATTAAAEKSYAMTGTLVSRDATKNEVTIDNEEIPGGVMAAMVMAYELRGADVSTLPADGTRIAVTLHERDGKYWVTDVRPLG